MSYVDSARSGGSRRAASAGAVAVIQAGVVLALVNGFGVTLFPTAHPPRTGTFNIPLPQPTIDPEPTPEPTTSVHREATIPHPTPLPPRRDETEDLSSGPVTRIDDGAAVAPTGGEGGEVIAPRPTPQPSPTLAPRAPRVANNPATWVTPLDYPTRDLNDGNQGTVRFEVNVGTDGRARSCRIVQSSGYPGLDAATCRNVVRRARFQPATNSNGNPVAGTYAGSIRWVIPDD